MAKKTNNNKKPSKILREEKRISNVILDKQGRKILDVDFIQQEYEDEENDTDYIITNAKHLELANGTIVSGTQISLPESQGGVTLQRCDGCVDETKTFLHWLMHRERSSIIFAPAKSMRRCFSCRRNFCEKHYVLTIQDKHIRCKACDRRFRRKRLFLTILKSLFLRNVDHE